MFLTSGVKSERLAARPFDHDGTISLTSPDPTRLVLVLQRRKAELQAIRPRIASAIRRVMHWWLDVDASVDPYVTYYTHKYALACIVMHTGHGVTFCFRKVFPAARTDVRLGKRPFRGTIENKGFTNQRFGGNEIRHETQARSRTEGTKPISYGPLRHETSARIPLNGKC
jgi:hypothetical protein